VRRVARAAPPPVDRACIQLRSSGILHTSTAPVTRSMKPPGGIRPATPTAVSLWRGWVLANIAGDMVGFGLAAAVAMGIAQLFQRAQGWQQALVFMFSIMVVGLVEGSAVGLAEWLALRRALPCMARGDWVIATVAGAICAWAAGMLIGTRLGEGIALPGTPLTSAVVVVSIGAIAGVVLSAFQWLVLRWAVEGAGWWVPAHAGAWALGMMVAFAGTSAIQDDTPVARVAFVGAATGLAMGALVAAITGLVLVRALRPRSTLVDRLPEQSAG